MLVVWDKNSDVWCTGVWSGIDKRMGGSLVTVPALGLTLLAVFAVLGLARSPCLFC